MATRGLDASRALAWACAVAARETTCDYDALRGTVKRLLAEGADAAHTSALDGGTSAWAVAVECEPISAALLAAGADPSVHLPGLADSTPLHLAIDRGQLSIAMLLLRHGSDASAVDRSFRGALHALVDRVRRLPPPCDGPGITEVEELVRALIASGANVDARDGDGTTPLLSTVVAGMAAAAVAATVALQRVAAALLCAGADTCAARFDSVSVASLLRGHTGLDRGTPLRDGSIVRLTPRARAFLARVSIDATWARRAPLLRRRKLVASPLVARAAAATVQLVSQVVDEQCLRSH